MPNPNDSAPMHVLAQAWSHCATSRGRCLRRRVQETQVTAGLSPRNVRHPGNSTRMATNHSASHGPCPSVIVPCGSHKEYTDPPKPFAASPQTPHFDVSPAAIDGNPDRFVRSLCADAVNMIHDSREDLLSFLATFHGHPGCYIQTRRSLRRPVAVMPGCLMVIPGCS